MTHAYTCGLQAVAGLLGNIGRKLQNKEGRELQVCSKVQRLLQPRCLSQAVLVRMYMHVVHLHRAGP